MQVAFNFYDYDENGSIGSVDILNLIKTFPQDKIKNIQKLYT